MKVNQGDYLRDGRKNDFPDFLIDLVSSSPYGSSCMKKRQSFVAGRGLSDVDTAEILVNENDTFQELHYKVAKDFAYSDRFAIKIIANAKGQIVQLFHVPFEAVRYGLPDENGSIRDVAVNHLFNTSDFRPSDTKHYPLFELNKGFSKLREDIDRINTQFKQEYYGHIYFYNASTEANRTYSRPSFFSVQDYLQVDSQIGQFHSRNIENNFFLGGIISVIGDPSRQLLTEEGEVYSTEGQLFEQQLGETFSGATNSGRWLIDWAQNADNKTTVQPWPGSSNHELFIALNSITRSAISIAFGIPEVLLGVETSGKLGNNQQIRNSIKFVNENTAESRSTLESLYSYLLANMSGTGESNSAIEPLQDFTDLPDNLIARLSQTQLDKYLADTYSILPDSELSSDEIQD